MKNTNIAIALVFGLAVTVASSSVNAQGLVGGANPILESGTTAGGLSLFEFFLDLSGADGSFDTVELIIESAGQMNQTGNDNIMQPSEDSGFSAFLTAPVTFGGQELSAFGVEAATDTASLLSGTHASLGDNSASTQGNYLLAQVTTQPGGMGTFVVNFFDDGAQTGSQTGTWGVIIPEPGTFALASLGLIGFIGRRRRS